MKLNKDTIETIAGMILMGVMFYAFYASLWIFCPC